MSNFDRIAPVYDFVSSLMFGEALRKAQKSFLSSVPAEANVLILGGGTGYVLEELLSSNQTCKVWYIEASRKMIDRARTRRHANDGRTTFIYGTHDDIDTKVVYDVVIMQFFLDLFSAEQISGLLEKLSGLSQPNSSIIAADFVNNAWWHDVMLRTMYPFFNITASVGVSQLPDWSNVIEKGGYSEKRSNHYFGRFIKSGLFLKNCSNSPLGKTLLQQDRILA